MDEEEGGGGEEAAQNEEECALLRETLDAAEYLPAPLVFRAQGPGRITANSSTPPPLSPIRSLRKDTARSFARLSTPSKPKSLIPVTPKFEPQTLNPNLQPLIPNL